MQTEIARLQLLVTKLKSCSSDKCRLEVLDCDIKVQRHLKQMAFFSAEHELLIKSLLAIDQHALLFLEDEASMRSLLEDLLPVESFYKDIGGIVGYHFMMSTFLMGTDTAETKSSCRYLRPPGWDISSDSEEVRAFVLSGLRALAKTAELYPVGGAADRLSLVDPVSQMALPAAKLLFCGKTLLEGLIRDVQAREYLYYKLFGAQVTVPIAMMTSQEKDNHRHILSIFENNRWFGRPKNAFHFFCQPAVPLMDKEGQWCVSKEKKIVMKPGGHGVIWKMARDHAVFEDWEKQGIEKILVRQINNPIAGCDHGLLAFCGIGHMHDKSFGFASCPRQVEAAEGVNVLLERKNPSGTEYCLTNVEYCDFKKFGIEDKPETQGSAYSWFPSNTNILFADIKTVQKVIDFCPIPGMIVNLKKMSLFEDREVARLESTMQNIADHLIDSFAEEQEDTQSALKTYLTYNLRRKTISTTKKEHVAGQSLLETPEGCFYDLLQNARDLLTSYCHFAMPDLGSPEEYLAQGPSFFFLYHPALGPLYSIIAQKIKRGILHFGSELQLEIADLCCEDLTLNGSLRIRAQQVVGDFSEEGLIRYSNQTGKCILKNVRVENRGISKDAAHCYWKNEILREESCEIILQGNGEFIAEDVTLKGDMRIEVQDGYSVRAVEQNGKIIFLNEKIDAPTWCWEYAVLESQIIASKKQRISC